MITETVGGSRGRVGGGTLTSGASLTLCRTKGPADGVAAALVVRTVALLMRSRPSRLTEEERLFTLPSLRSCHDFGGFVTELDSVPWVEERMTPRRPAPESRRTGRRCDRLAA